MRVLAIEDNRAFLELMHSHLAKRGFTVDTAGSLADALMLTAGGAYEVVLLDLGLPDGDGIEVIERLRCERSAMPVIVLSARGGILDRVELLESGADDYLVKPFDLDELVARIRAVARRGTARQAEQLAFADVAFDRQSRGAVVNGRPVMLRPREAALLEALLRLAGADLLLQFLDALLQHRDLAGEPGAPDVELLQLGVEDRGDLRIAAQPDRFS